MNIHTANQETQGSAGRTRARARCCAYASVLALLSIALFPVACPPLAPAPPLLEKAQASGAWPLPSPRLSVDVGFRDSYEFAGKTYIHWGVDIAADAGTQVSSPVAGTVSFVGTVPAGESLAVDAGQGVATQAVSIAMADGRTVTLMPVEDVFVEEGDALAEGQGVAVLAASGDRSSAAPHLHLGLKSGRSYYDPLSLFGISDADGAEQDASGVLSGAVVENTGDPAEGASAQAAAVLVGAAEPVAEDAVVGGEAAGVAAVDVVAAGAADAVLGGEQAGGVLEEGAAGAGQLADAGSSGLQALEDGAGSISSGSVSHDALHAGAPSGTGVFAAPDAFFSAAVAACAGWLWGVWQACSWLAGACGLPQALVVAVLALVCLAGLSAIVRFTIPKVRACLRGLLAARPVQSAGFLRKTSACASEEGVVG